MTETYLKPSSADKSLVLNAKPACGGELNSIFIYPDQRDWIRVRISALRNFQNPSVITLSVSVQKSLGMVLFSNEEERRLRDERWDKWITVEASDPEITVKSHSISRQLSMSAFDLSDQAMTKYYLPLGEWELTSDFPAGFIMEMPELVVDGVKMKFAPIHFELTHEIVEQALNC